MPLIRIIKGGNERLDCGNANLAKPLNDVIIPIGGRLWVDGPLKVGNKGLDGGPTYLHEGPDGSAARFLVRTLDNADEMADGRTPYSDECCHSSVSNAPICVL